MNQDQNQPNLPPATPNPTPRASRPARRTRLFIYLAVGIIVAAALIGISIYAFHNKAAKDDNQTRLGDSSHQQSQSASTNQSDQIIITLPNGKVASFANTKENQDFSFLSSSAGSDYVDISSKSINQFVSTADTGTVATLCGAHGELAPTDDIIIATMSTIARVISYPTQRSCLDELASLRNTNPASRSNASALATQVRANIKLFYARVVIK